MPQVITNIKWMFAEYANKKVSTYFYEHPNPKTDVQYNGFVVFDSLEEALQAVIDDYPGHFAYDLVVHVESGVDRPLSQNEIVALLAQQGGLRTLPNSTK